MNKRMLAGIGVAAAVAVVAGWLFLDHRGDGRYGVLVLYGNVDVRTLNLAFQVEGRLAEMAVDEGDRVTPGQRVAALDTGYLQDAVRIAEGRVAAQQAQLAKLEAGMRPEEIGQARADVERLEALATNARKKYDRQVALPLDSAVSRQSLDNARAEFRQSEAMLRQARESLKLAEEGYRAEDIAAQRAQLSAEQALLDLARRRLADAVLTAPSEAVVLTRVHEPGAVLLPGTPVYSVALTEPVWVRTYAPEAALGRVVPGAEVRVTTDAASGRAYRGQVGFVSPVAEFTPKTIETPDLRTALVYRVRVIIADPDDSLRQGMPVTVHIGG